MEAVLDAGAQEVNDLGKLFVSESKDLVPVRTAYKTALTPNLPILPFCLLCMSNSMQIAKKLFELIDAIEELMMQNVFSNLMFQMKLWRA